MTNGVVDFSDDPPDSGHERFGDLEGVELLDFEGGIDLPSERDQAYRAALVLEERHRLGLNVLTGERYLGVRVLAAVARYIEVHGDNDKKLDEEDLEPFYEI